MSIAEKIKEAAQTAQQPRKNILKLIVGELDRVSKTPTDKQTEAVLLFLIKSATETGAVCLQSDLEKVQLELSIYESFLPPQPKVLTQEEIKEVVVVSGVSTVPALMKHLGTYEKEYFVTIDKAYARSLL